MTGVLIAAAVIALPALAFVLWPLLRRGGQGTFLALPPDAREQLTEQKRAVLRALHELDFEHDAGHLSDDDYADLRARYEADAAQVLAALDQLGPERPQARRGSERVAETSRRSAWQHPLAVAASAVFLVVFGVGIGVGIVRYTTADQNGQGGGGAMGGGMPAGIGGSTSGSAPIASAPMTTPGAKMPSGPLPPAVLAGMLKAAREALFSGNYAEALSAYRAILERDKNNVDALSHVGLMAAMANHPDKALELIDRALAIDPKFAPALLYRGQVLYETKGDTAGAIKTWERYLAVAPNGEDRDRVTKLIAEAKSRPAPAPRR